MKDLSKHVLPIVATKWYDLGLELLDPKHERALDIIEENFTCDVERCCRKMFSKWLETCDDASWAHLIEAVRTIELNEVASNIEQLVLQGERVSVQIAAS